MSADMKTVIHNHFRAQLDAGRMAMMTSVRQTPGNEIVFAIKAAGFHAIFIDLEHGMLSLTQAGQLCVMGLACGVTPIVRIPGHIPHIAGQILDLGAMGIIIPHVDTAEQAKRMVDACMYPPVGHRGFSSTIPQLQSLSFPAKEVRAHINSQTTVMPQIETREGVENTEAIASVEGVDMIEVGGNDLLLDMGIPGDYENPKLMTALKKVAEGAKKAGKHFGVGGVPENVVKEVYAMGGKLMSVGGDINLLAGAMKAAAEKTRRLEN